jgi:uncharacterized membrane protein
MIQTQSIQFGDARRGNHRSVAAQKWGALIGGSALAIYGLTRRSALGVALAAGGGTIAYLGVNQKSRHSQSSTWTSLLINCTPQEAYRFWRDFENLPRFMNRLETVTVLDDRRSRWVALGPLNRRPANARTSTSPGAHSRVPTFKWMDALSFGKLPQAVER